MTVAVPATDAAIAEACRGSIMAYGAFVHGLQPATHHQAWVRSIRKLLDEGGRLLLTAFPGAAKSTWVSICIEWWLGNNPDMQALFLTASDAKARDFGTSIRTTMEGDKFALVFPDERCRPDTKRGWSGDGLWLKGTPADSRNPAFRSTGFDSNIQGSRPHLVVMDDPIEQERAQSETEQPKDHRYHDGTIVARLHPDKPREIFITTRWHENDLASHVLGKGTWQHHNFPALDEKDESTWPERFSTEYVRQMRKDLGTALFRCVWMGDPTSLGGSVFREESWFRPLPPWFDRRNDDGKTERERLNIVQFWDFAYSEKKTADYSACCTVGQNQTMDLFVVGAFRRRIDQGDLLDALVEQWEMHQPFAIGVEQGIWDKYQVVKDLVRRARRQIPCPIITIPARAEKRVRALLPAARAENGQLFVDKDAPWAHDFIAQCLGFPLASHDDYVDALSGAAELLATRLSVLYDLRGGPRTHYSIGSRPEPQQFSRVPLETPPWTKEKVG